jgi:hypothetical protein
MKGKQKAEEKGWGMRRRFSALRSRFSVPESGDEKEVLRMTNHGLPITDYLLPITFYQ